MLYCYLPLIGCCKFGQLINSFFKYIFICSDRLRTTNNIVGNCYASVVIEHLSQKELKTSDAKSDKNSFDETKCRLVTDFNARKDNPLSEAAVIEMS